jgi:hypothetical protein
MTRKPATQAHPITPFWQRLGPIFAYPLQREALFTVVLLAIARILVYVPAIGWLIDLLITIAILRYAGEVLYRSAHGHAEAPTGLNDDDSRGWTLFWVQVCLFLLLLFAGFVGVAMEAPVVGLLGMVLVALGTPGALISAAIDGDWARALNPLLWINVMLRLGGAYFLLSGLCLLIALSSGNAEDLLGSMMPGPLAVITSALAAHYALVATFHLMGYTVWQYHERLGFEPDTGAMLPALRTDPDAVVLAQAEALAADGELAAAEAVLREHIRERGGSDAMRARHRKLLHLRGDKPALLADGREGINILLARDDERRALDLWRECRALDPGFWPSDPEQVFRLASKASTMGLTDLALKSVTGFHKAFPKHRDIPRNYLLAARLMVDRFGEDAKALVLLRQLQTGFPQHPLAAEIADYARVVETLVAKGPKA